MLGQPRPQPPQLNRSVWVLVQPCVPSGRRQYPNASNELRWQWLFPATRTYRHATTSQILRHHLLGHRDVSATMIYTHVLNRGPAGVRSPLDR